MGASQRVEAEVEWGINTQASIEIALMKPVHAENRFHTDIRMNPFRPIYEPLSAYLLSLDFHPVAEEAASNYSRTGLTAQA